MERSNAVNSKLQHRQEQIEELNQVRMLLHKLQVSAVLGRGGGLGLAGAGIIPCKQGTSCGAGVQRSFCQCSLQFAQTTKDIGLRGACCAVVARGAGRV